MVFRWGMLARHGLHQVAQKSSTTGLALEVGEPDEAAIERTERERGRLGLAGRDRHRERGHNARSEATAGESSEHGRRPFRRRGPPDVGARAILTLSRGSLASGPCFCSHLTCVSSWIRAGFLEGRIGAVLACRSRDWTPHGSPKPHTDPVPPGRLHKEREADVDGPRRVLQAGGGVGASVPALIAHATRGFPKLSCCCWWSCRFILGPCCGAACACTRRSAGPTRPSSMRSVVCRPPPTSGWSPSSIRQPAGARRAFGTALDGAHPPATGTARDEFVTRAMDRTPPTRARGSRTTWDSSPPLEALRRSSGCSGPCGGS